MNMKKYLGAVRRRLNMPKELKDRVMADFLCALEARQEEGLSEEMILSEFGTPKQAAAELNAQMKEYTYQKSPWRWLCLALAVFSGLCLAYKGLLRLLLVLFNKAYNSSVGIIGGADGPTAIYVTSNASPAMGIYILLLVMGLVGFLALRKLSKK